MKKIITKTNSKHCSLDPIPTALLKNCIAAILPIICKIVNLSLQESTVPDYFKQAIVTPLIKKSSLDPENMKNFRPVSNLPYISKLLEKVVMTRLNNHLDTHKLREPLQSAYLANHSTETALVKVFSDILCAMDKGQCVLLVLLDLSAAFDTIDHELMLSRLEGLFGIKGDALAWVKSYFSGRTQKVVLENCSSKPVPLSTGVPQGSVAGPGTFSAYTQPLGTLVREHNVNLHLYADDTQLYIGCTLKDQDIVKHKLEACVESVRVWMAANMLKLNDSKTEYLLIGSKHSLHHVPENIKVFQMGEERITMSSSARNIGVYMDPTLSMKDHISHICSSCYLGLRDISRIRRYLTEETTKPLVMAFVQSKLDCNNALLYKISKTLIAKLQLVQNNAARLIVKRRKYDPIEDVREELHWLPVEFRIQYKIIILTFKCINHIAPSYLCDLLEPYNAGRATRSEGKGLLKEEKTQRVAGDRAFAHAAPYLWRLLPQNLRDMCELGSFKNALKTHLFKVAFRGQLDE